MKTLDHVRNGSLLVLLTAALTSCGGDKTSSTSGSGGSSTAQTSSGGGGSGGSGTGAAGFGGSGGATTGSTTTDTGTTTSSTTSGTTTTTTSTMNTSVRRPFLVGGSLRSAGALGRRDWSAAMEPAPALDRATADLLARSWLQDALEEHASVAAFARFTMQLLALGAPADLVERSQRASLDEVRHARACFALAERYGAGARGPAPLVVHDAMGASTLAEVAALTAQEGCVGETLGAALAQEQLVFVTDREVLRVLRRIAADEARHAELAWRFVRWAITTGGAEVERAVRDAMESAISATLGAELRAYDGIDLDAYHAHGRVTCAEARAAAERAIRDIVRPCAALLGARLPSDAVLPVQLERVS